MTSPDKPVPAKDRQKRGASLTGYGLIVGLIAIVALSATTNIGSSVTSLFVQVGGQMEDAVDGTVGASASSSGAEATPTPSCSSARASCAAHLAAGCTADGPYQIDPDDGGSAFAETTLFCDMNTDDGGWTLAYKNSSSNSLAFNNMSEQGSPSTCLNSLADNCSAKLSDDFINALGGTGSGAEIGYRMDSPNIGNAYFFPNQCRYRHESCGNNFGNSGASHVDCQPTNADACMRYTDTYTASSSPTYTQCNDWGGHGAGLNAWYQCNDNGYTNVAITHRGYAENGGITTNASGVDSGGPSTTHGNTSFMWVR
ncbi:MAG: hypothetical protein Alpg2KO_05330 [Alphaproteobacteria bacterium]